MRRYGSSEIEETTETLACEVKLWSILGNHLVIRWLWTLRLKVEAWDRYGESAFAGGFSER